MQWLADNAVNGYLLLAFAAFMLAGVWWIQKQIVYLVGAGLALVGLGVFWLVIHKAPTTAMRMESDLKSLVDAIKAKDHDKAARYVDADFKYKAKNPEKWYAYLEKELTEQDVDTISIEKFDVKSSDGDTAKVEFELHARRKSKDVYARECECDLTRSADSRDGDVWRLSKISLHKLGGGKKSKDDD